MAIDAAQYSGIARTNLLVAQADYGKALIERDASKYTGDAKRNLLAAQADFSKSLMDKVPRK